MSNFEAPQIQGLDDFARPPSSFVVRLNRQESASFDHVAELVIDPAHRAVELIIDPATAAALAIGFVILGGLAVKGAVNRIRPRNR